MSCKHSPGPWAIDARSSGVLDIVDRDGEMIAATRYLGNAPEAVETHHGNASIFAEAPDRIEQLIALLRYNWTVDKVSLYDEEGVEGWCWTEPNGREHTEIGDWNELPPWPDSARAALAARLI